MLARSGRKKPDSFFFVIGLKAIPLIYLYCDWLLTDCDDIKKLLVNISWLSTKLAESLVCEDDFYVALVEVVKNFTGNTQGGARRMR